jgi:hypothetical protein
MGANRSIIHSLVNVETGHNLEIRQNSEECEISFFTCTTGMEVMVSRCDVTSAMHFLASYSLMEIRSFDSFIISTTTDQMAVKCKPKKAVSFCSKEVQSAPSTSHKILQ